MSIAMDALLDRLAEAEAVLLEPQEQFNQALIGMAQNANGLQVAAYDSAKVVAALQQHDQWDHDEAQEYFEFNIQNAYMGEHSPIFVDLWILE